MSDIKKWLDKQFGKELKPRAREMLLNSMKSHSIEAAKCHARLAEDDRRIAQRQAALYGINYAEPKKD